MFPCIGRGVRPAIITGLLAGTVTAFCGPIAFLGLVTPHIAWHSSGTPSSSVGVGDRTYWRCAGPLFQEVLARLPLANGAL
ncbi:MAG: iron chelate uptake ABC transporter family permease subunit, partial [Flavobacteriales bacterium]|nr:iron chelate uptake ABC transporter family permease subunit [Flavobacteriales bacterium]